MDTHEKNMQSRLDSMIEKPNTPKQKEHREERGIEIFQSVNGKYHSIRTQLKPDQSINLICLVGGISFEVYEISAHDFYLEVKAKTKSGDIHIITASVEQIAFDIVVSKKTQENEGWNVKFMGFTVDASKAES
jgi:hypothetical protein